MRLSPLTIFAILGALSTALISVSFLLSVTYSNWGKMASVYGLYVGNLPLCGGKTGLGASILIPKAFFHPPALDEEGIALTILEHPLATFILGMRCQWSRRSEGTSNPLL